MGPSTKLSRQNESPQYRQNGQIGSHGYDVSEIKPRRIVNENMVGVYKSDVLKVFFDFAEIGIKSIEVKVPDIHIKSKELKLVKLYGDETVQRDYRVQLRL